jgi:hypothetical protein
VTFPVLLLSSFHSSLPHLFMKQNLAYKTVTAVLLVASLWGCTKEQGITPTSGPITARPINQDVGANYDFDWENALKMPKSSLQGAPDVFPPWKSQGGTAINAAIVQDYKKVDGWKLVYNTFMPDNYPNPGDQGTYATATQKPAGGLYFALYNKYRGLLRYYFYTPPGVFTNSKQYSHGLQVYTAGNTTKAFNFEGVAVVDVDQSISQFLQTNKTGIALDGGWYAMQYEIAYDPTIANTTYPNPGFNWNVFTTSVTDIKLDGVLDGKINGTITKADPPAGFDWFSPTSAALDILSTVFTATLGTDATAIQKGALAAVNSGTSGSAKDFLSGLFGKTSSGAETVDLTLNATIELTGTATSTSPYVSNAFVFPGQSAGTNGLPPLYSQPLGLFNLGQKATVTRQYGFVRSPLRGGNNEYTYDYNLDASSVLNALQFNPNTFNATPEGATVEGLVVQLVVLNPGPLWNSAQTRETIGSGFGYSSQTSTGGVVSVNLGYSGTSMYGGPAGVPVARVSFFVKPNNGSPRTLVVKSFALNVQVI